MVSIRSELSIFLYPSISILLDVTCLVFLYIHLFNTNHLFFFPPLSGFPACVFLLLVLVGETLSMGFETTGRGIKSDNRRYCGIPAGILTFKFLL